MSRHTDTSKTATSRLLVQQLLPAERCERGSVLLTGNLPFSNSEQIFNDSMSTAAAIDRLVHHSVILELNVPSYRLEKARKSKRESFASE